MFKLIPRSIEIVDYEKAIYKYTKPPYKQHSTVVETGQEGFIKFFSEFTKRCPNRKFDVLHQFSQDNMAFVSVLQTLDNQKSWFTMDIFIADDDNKIIEHFDIIEKYKDQTTNDNFINENIDTNITTKFINNNSIIDLIKNAKVTNSINVIDHNIKKVHKRVIQNNMADLLVKTEDNAAIHVFQIENNEVIQHWDTMEPIPTPEVGKNYGKF